MTHLRYRADIDGLRALAIVPVVLFHGRLGPLSGGFVGVDIFFVISGFLITSLILKDLELGSFSFKDFYARRVRRIIPALTCMLSATTLAALFLYTPRELRSYAGRLVATALFGANIQFSRSANYFAPRAEDLELLHCWSLAVEEQFYFVF